MQCVRDSIRVHFAGLVPDDEVQEARQRPSASFPQASEQLARNAAQAVQWAGRAVTGVAPAASAAACSSPATAITAVPAKWGPGSGPGSDRVSPILQLFHLTPLYSAIEKVRGRRVCVRQLEVFAACGCLSCYVLLLCRTVCCLNGIRGLRHHSIRH